MKLGSKVFALSVVTLSLAPTATTGCTSSADADVESVRSGASTCSDTLGPHRALDAALPKLCTKDGKYTAVLQTDGNFVLYRNDAGGPAALWSTQTTGTKRVDMQGDCNLVVVTNQDTAAWTSQTSQRARDCNLRLTESGELRVESTAGVIWSSETGEDFVVDDGQSSYWDRKVVARYEASAYVDELRGNKTVTSRDVAGDPSASVVSVEVWKGIVPSGLPRLRGSRTRRTTNITVAGRYPTGTKKFSFESEDVRFPRYTWMLPDLPLRADEDGIVSGWKNPSPVRTTRASVFSFTNTRSMQLEEHVTFDNGVLTLSAVQYATGTENIEVLTSYGKGIVSRPHWYGKAIAVVLTGVDPAFANPGIESFRVVDWTKDLNPTMRDLTPNDPVIGLTTKESSHNFELPLVTLADILDAPGTDRLRVSSTAERPSMKAPR